MKHYLGIRHIARGLFALMIAMAVLPVLTGPAVAFQSTAPAFKAGDCSAYDFPVTLSQMRTVECGYLVVPELHEKPDGKTIQLGVAILKSRAATVQPDPLVMLQGGPGGSTLHDFPSFLSIGSLLSSDRDIILFDQRGTLYTTPKLNCSESQDLTYRTLNEKLSDAESLRLELETLGKCRDRLMKQGVNLAAYTSLENAADVDALRQALGYQQINLYGVSYGTLLALDVMRAYPQGLRTVILDSVVTPQDNYVQGFDNTNARSLFKIFDACAADATCNRNYPDLQKVFLDQVDRLNKNPVHLSLTNNSDGKTYPSLLDGDSLIRIIFQALYNTPYIPLIPQIIYDAKGGNYSFIQQVASQVVFDFSISEGMFYSVNCSDYQNEAVSQANPMNLPPELLHLRQTDIASFFAVCKLWNVPQQNAIADQPVVSDIPTLITTGEYDPATPPVNGQTVAKTLSHSYLVSFPAGGHGEIPANPCGEQILEEFLNSPDQKPDIGCISSQGPQFETPATLVRIPGLVSLLNLEGPSLFELGAYFVALVLLLTALLVYPIRWLAGLFRSKPQAAQPAYPNAELYGQASGNMPVLARPVARPIIWRLAPWLAAGVGILLTAFTAIFIAVLFSLILKSDQRLLFGIGLPGNVRPLFFFTLLAAVGMLAMVALGLTSWLRSWGTVWGRVYFTVLALAAVTCVVVLGLWGMLTTVFPI